VRLEGLGQLKNPGKCPESRKCFENLKERNAVKQTVLYENIMLMLSNICESSPAVSWELRGTPELSNHYSAELSEDVAHLHQSRWPGSLACQRIS
jgi:hypothetical protein